MSWLSRDTFILPMRGQSKEMYLDTRAWSELARGNHSPPKLDQWLERNSGFLSISPHTAVELCRQPDLAGQLAEFMEPRKTVLLTHGKDEIAGKKIFWASWFDLWYPVDFSDEGARAIFIEEMQEGSICDVTHTVKEYSTWLPAWLDDSLRNVSLPDKDPWTHFNSLLKEWLAARATAAGQSLVPEGLSDPDCYRGVKLQFGFMFERFYIGQKSWSDSDFADFLHFREMAYADAVLAEESLANCIKEVQQHLPWLGPREIYDLSWLNSLRGPTQTNEV